MRRAFAVVALSVAAGAATFAHQAQAPVFRGAADVVVSTMQVMGRDGAPVEDLTIADFSLKVDGRPRAIASVELQRIDDARPVAASSSASTLSMAPPVTAQSFVMVVADPFMMRPESSRLLFDQAAEFVAKLPRAHAVGLWLLPSSRPQFPFSENRQPIVAALKRQLGGLGANSAPTPADTMLAMPGIDGAVAALRAADGRRTLLFLSDALPPAGKDPADPLDTAKLTLMAISRRAADAGVVIHTVTTAPPAFRDVGQRYNVPAPNANRGFLPLLSDQTGGLYIERGSNASVVLPRIERLLAAQYVMSFNVENDDRDGKPHKIEVKVNRKGVEVTVRKEFVR